MESERKCGEYAVFKGMITGKLLRIDKKFQGNGNIDAPGSSNKQGKRRIREGGKELEAWNMHHSGSCDSSYVRSAAARMTGNLMKAMHGLPMTSRDA